MGYEYEELVISTVYDLNSEMYPDKEIEIIKSELKEVYAKAKAFDEIEEVFKDYPLKTDSDVMDFIQAKLDDMEDE